MKLALVLMLLAAPAVAREYLVVLLPLTVAEGTELSDRQRQNLGVIETRIEPGPHGSTIDGNKTDVLNALAAEGWRVIAVTSVGIGPAAVYLERD